MASAFARILVAAREAAAVSSVVLDKAATIARGSGARIEIFHALNEPLATAAIRGAPAPGSLEENTRRAVERAQRRLQRIAAAPVFGRLKVGVHVQCDYPPHEAIIRRAIAQRCDLVIAETRPHRLGARMLLANTDWELIRHCPIPLLLIKSRKHYERPAIVAAVDPFHARAKPAALDAQIVKTATRCASALRGEVHLFHAYVPTVVMVPTAAAPPLAVEVSPELLQIEARRVCDAIDRLGVRAHVPALRRHVMPGDVYTQIDAVVRETGARIVVMGAVSRSALRRFFIGNTAERVLDRLECDVLVVKPRGFRTDIPQRIARRTGAGRRGA